MIELSDDEIQIVVPTLTRIEMLELLPNIASQSVIIQQISRNYIPHTIKLHKDIYRYETKRLRSLSEIDSKMRSKHSKQNLQEIPHSSSTSSQASNKIIQRNYFIPLHNQSMHTNICDVVLRALYFTQLTQYSRFEFFQLPNNRLPFYRQAYWHNRGTIIRENLHRNNSHAFMFGNLRHFRTFRNTVQQNRYFLIKIYLIRNIIFNISYNIIFNSSIYHFFLDRSMHLWQMLEVKRMSINHHSKFYQMSLRGKS